MACQQILVIEDEVDLRETIKDLLEISGFKVATAENGREGLRLLQEIEAPCLVLLDLMMPVMNGWEFLETLKSQHQPDGEKISVTVISAAADLTDVQRKYGCNILRKPVPINQLLALAQQHCSQ